VRRRVFGFSACIRILMENSRCSARVRRRILAQTRQRERKRESRMLATRFPGQYPPAIRIFGQFGGQIVPHSPPARLNTEDNPRGLLRYHVGPYVLMGRMP